MKMTMRYLTAGSLALAMAACATERPAEDTAVLDTTPAVTTPPAATIPMDTGMAGMAGMGEQVNLSPVGNSGVTGEAMVSGTGNETQVRVQLTGLQPNTNHAGHIHQGTCANPGEVVAPLQEITAGADGTGTMTTTVSVPSNTVMSGQHLVAYHESGDPNHGPPIVCGEIPQHTM